MAIEKFWRKVRYDRHMKLLLTSAGIKDNHLANALLDLAGKPAKELKVAFIPTAANFENEDKTWLIDNLAELSDMHFGWLDIVDIAALNYDESIKRLKDMDVVVVGGGKTKNLVEILRELRLDAIFREWLSSKVFVGISAGSVMTGPIINPHGDQGLHWVDFLIVPHMNASFANRSEDQIQAAANSLQKTIYWIGDSSAVMINDANISFIGTEYKVVEAR